MLEELGTYDPMVADVDARAVLNGERVKYWLSVGAQPTEKVKVLIKKYGSEGTHLEQQKAALDRLAQARRRPEPPVHEVGPSETDEAEEALLEEVPLQEAPLEEVLPEAAPAAEVRSEEIPPPEPPRPEAPPPDNE